MLFKNFHQLFSLLYRDNFLQNIFSPNISCWMLVLMSTIFLMHWISRSFNISNFISSGSQVFSRIDVLKKLRKVQRKTPALKCILIKMQTLTFFVEQLCASVILTVLKYDFQCIVHFSPTFVTFQRVYQTQ